MRTLNLTRTATSTTDANGNGTVSIGPGSPGEVWLPTGVNTSMAGNVPTGSTPATVTLYAGNGISPAYQIDNSYQVLGASSSMIAGKQIFEGQTVSAVFANGNPNSTIQLNVFGTRTLP